MKHRGAYLLIIIVIIGAGLLSRKLPLAYFIGDVLYAIMIYFILRLISPRSLTLHSAILAIAVCFAIEFSQLYQQPWANELRATWIGRHILGSGFLFTDLIALAAGVFLGWLPDKTLNIQNRG